MEESGANTAVFRPEAPTRPIEKPVTGQGRQLSTTMTLLAALLVLSVLGNIFLAIWRGGGMNGADDPAAGLGGGDLRADLVPGVGAIQGVRQVAGQRCGPLTGLVSRRMLTSPLRRIL